MGTHYCVLFSGKLPIISFDIIYRLVFIIDAVCVLHGAEAEILYISYISTVKRGGPSSSPDQSMWGRCGGQNGTKTGFCLTTSVFPCQHHFTSAPHSPLSDLRFIFRATLNGRADVRSGPFNTSDDVFAEIRDHQDGRVYTQMLTLPCEETLGSLPA